MLYVRKIAVLSLFALLAVACLAQDGPYEIEIDEPSTETGFQGEIHYINIENGLEAKTIDLNGISPLRSIGLPDAQYNSVLRKQIYDLTNWDLSECLPDIRQYTRYRNADDLYSNLLNRELLTDAEFARIVRDKGNDYVPDLFAWNWNMIAISNGHPYAVFNLIFGYCDTVLAQIAWIYVFSDSGEVLYKEMKYNGGLSYNAIITEDGEHLMYLNGIASDEDGPISDTNGYRIIDMRNRSVILEKNYPMNVSVSLFSNKGHDFFIYATRNSDETRECIFVFPNEGILASHEFDYDFVKAAQASESDNFIIKRNNRGEIVEIVVMGKQFTLEAFK